MAEQIRASRGPRRIELSGSRVIITWEGGHVSNFDGRALRVLCPCAHCVEEMTGRKLLDPSTVPDEVQALDKQEMGNYAVQFLWSDGHFTGIYTYEALRAMCPCEECRAKRGG